MYVCVYCSYIYIGEPCGGCSADCDVPSTPSVLVLTEDGLSLMEVSCWKLSAKATYYENMINPRHDRYGLVGSCGLTSTNDLSTYVLKDSDNDGLWTSIYTSSQVLKAATLAQESVSSSGDDAVPSADFNASIAQVQEHFAALKKLFDVANGQKVCVYIYIDIYATCFIDLPYHPKVFFFWHGCIDHRNSISLSLLFTYILTPQGIHGSQFWNVW
jgi:hypothetical protein